MDDLYDAAIVRPVRSTLTAATLHVEADRIDATVNGSGRATAMVGAGLRRLQSGNVQAYATMMFLGVIVLAVGLAVR